MNTINKTEEKVFSFMEEHHMLQAGDRVVAGVSGGADSICLLFVLLKMAQSIPLSIGVVHVDHSIRAESGEDARYVEELCRRYELPFYLTKADVRGRAEEMGCSEEEAGRDIRYEAFARAAEAFHANKIAVAHNSNDCAETMLFYLFRGSGLKGLCGIAPVREEIIRPLLCLERQEIEQYLTEKGIIWRTDCTNEQDDYTRNRIRHHILPFAEKEIASGCVAHMTRTAAMLSETEAYLEEQTEEAMKSCVCVSMGHDGAVERYAGIKEHAKTSEKAEIKIAEFNRQHIVIQKRMLHRLIKNLTPHLQDISYVHMEAVLELFSREGNRGLDLPFGIKAVREYGKVTLYRDSETEAAAGQQGMAEKEGKSFVFCVAMPEVLEKPLEIDLGRLGKLVFSVFFQEKEQEVLEKKYTKWFDYDKIEKSLVVRTRQTGDYFSFADGKGGQLHKSLKQYMINEKIPPSQREEIPLLAAGEHVLWLVGYRISEYYKISKNTKRILQVQLKRDCEDSTMEESYGREC